MLFSTLPMGTMDTMVSMQIDVIFIQRVEIHIVLWAAIAAMAATFVL